MSLISLAVSLFLLMDSIGNVPIFLSILKEIEPKRQRFIICRELIIALIIIVSFYFLGNVLLKFLGITQPAVLISGGIILFIIGIKLVFPTKEKAFDWNEGGEPFLVPMAVPLVAGPAVLAAVVLYSHQQLPMWTCLGAIFIAWLASTVILLSAIPLQKLLGDRGLAACERFTGLLLIMIAVQMFLNGLSATLQ
ncbi:MAG: MarC family protein [Simkaniaceae bacterium]|nr:MarC family protein [Candidatus Sacchlamyda saccharinae]